ncbi:MAG TPA: DUF5937 family protein, partial [Solirubrobacteraceae bacterium]
VGDNGYGVDFPARPPTTPLPDLDAELEHVAATPGAQVRRELALRWPDGDVPEVVQPLQADPRRGLRALTALMREYWERALAPDWAAIRALAEADIARRSRHLAERGVRAVFDDLHHEVSWHGDELRFVRRYDDSVELGGRGVLLVPAVFAWPRTFAMYDPPWQPTLLYPPRGIGDLWAPSPGAGAGDGLAPLLGARRAAILAALDAPASTSELAQRMRLPVSSVSEHLGVLRGAGLVQPGRDGRHVRYARTDLGDRLVSPR